MDSPCLLPTIPPSLSEQLKSRTDEVRCRIVRENLNTQFGQAAPELADFRRANATANLDDDDVLSDAFCKTVQFTSYDAYAPLVAKFSEKPCKANEVVNLLAPGLPDCLVESSSTSGGLPKTFAKYNCLPKIVIDTGSLVISDSSRKRTRAYIFNLRYDQMDIEDNENSTAATICFCSGSVVGQRGVLNLHPEQDEERMGAFILDHASPYAAAFVKKWRSFLLIHALFAISSRSLEIVSMVFINTFVDMMRHLDAEFDTIVNFIELGTIPDLEGMEEVRHYLEPNISPDPERAEELRRLGRPSSFPGWCSLVWPSLHSVIGVSSGSFAASVPLAQWYIGPNVNICPLSYGSSECLVIALPYNPLEKNQYKPFDANIIEFLDFGKGDSISALAQLWEVELEKQYEIVLTTPDGLWRYRLGDVVEIAGFDPTDGTPIIQFVERRNVIMRFPNFMFTESDLMAAIFSIPLANIVDWTATIDDRCTPATIGFFIELANDQVSGLESNASGHVLDALAQSNANVAQALADAQFQKPTIWVVRSGTFSAFRQMKLDEGAGSLGQVKMPSVLPKAAYVTWFLDRVVKEL